MIAPGRLLIRAGFFAALWVILTRADLQSWLIGAPAVVFATWISLRPASTSQRPTARGPAGSMHGLASINLATPALDRHAASVRLLSLCFQHLPAFVGFFLIASIRGGVDITQRILSWPLAISPGFLTYRTALHHPGARIFFLDLISLLPGTLSADFIEPDRLIIHALDTRGDNYRELARLEYQVARLFCEPIGGGNF